MGNSQNCYFSDIIEAELSTDTGSSETSIDFKFNSFTFSAESSTVNLICEISLCLVDEADCYTSCDPPIQLVEETVNEVRVIDNESNPMDNKSDGVEDDAIEDVTTADSMSGNESDEVFDDVSVTEIVFSGDYEDVLHPIGNETHIFDI